MLQKRCHEENVAAIALLWKRCPPMGMTVTGVFPRNPPILLNTGDIVHWHNILTGRSELIFKAMNSLLYLIAVILIIGWLLGFFVYSAGGLIHALLVLAVIAILINIIRGRAV